MKIVKTSLAILSTIVFVSCGGGGSASGGGNGGGAPGGGNGGGNPQGQVMEKNKVYEMSSGDTIVKKSDPTIIKLEVDLNTNKTKATLQSGSAVIE